MKTSTQAEVSQIKKMHSHGPLVWTFLMFLSSYVISPGAAVSGSGCTFCWWMHRRMTVPTVPCTWHGRTGEEFVKLPQLIQCRTELGISSHLFSVLGSELLFRTICLWSPWTNKPPGYLIWTHELAAWWECLGPEPTVASGIFFVCLPAGEKLDWKAKN